MEGIDDIKTDAHIANILKRLKDAAPAKKAKEENDDVVEQTKEDNNPRSLEVSVKDIPVESIPRPVIDRKEDIKVNDTLEDHKFVEEGILPWFSKTDKDINLLHYIKLNNAGNLEYCSIKTDRPAEVIASLKIKPDYLCDIDYYKSRHYVLYAKQLDSDYTYNRTYTPENKVIVIDETQIVSDESTANESAGTSPELVKITSDDLTAEVACSDKYTHCVVFTDLGIADFIGKSDEVICSCCNPDLNKWFEETSNYIQLKNTEYDANPRVISEDAANIRDFKYDIVTMHRPGIITLDSVDNNDPDYQVHIKLKDEFNFIPMSRVLCCLKDYSLNSNKSIDDFRRFINRYFDIIA